MHSNLSKHDSKHDSKCRSDKCALCFGTIAFIEGHANSHKYVELLFLDFLVSFLSYIICSYSYAVELMSFKCVFCRKQDQVL